MHNPEEKIFDHINKEIITKFPYLADVTPVQKELPNGNLQLSYMAVVKTENDIDLPINVRVVVSGDGRIVKMSTSR